VKNISRYSPVRGLFGKLKILKKINTKKLIFYYLNKNFLNGDCSFYLLNNKKKINLLK
tara:strand:- start:2 stop:175 length:174 start_codon:yes stop_codon:yes gene_type:complete